MIKLSQRLLAIASFVRPNAKIIDIGCDHALVDIYLAQKNPKNKIIAVDVRKGAINQAKQNIAKYHLEKKIDLRLSNGLDSVSKKEIDTIIMSGLGCAKIIYILTKNHHKLDMVNDLIVQPNTDFYQIRKVICNNNYYIKEEQLIKENNHLYLVIHFIRGYKKYNAKDYFFGPILRRKRSTLYKELIAFCIKTKQEAYHLVPKYRLLKKIKLKYNILTYKKELK